MEISSEKFLTLSLSESALRHTAQTTTITNNNLKKVRVEWFSLVCSEPVRFSRILNKKLLNFTYSYVQYDFTHPNNSRLSYFIRPLMQ